MIAARRVAILVLTSLAAGASSLRPTRQLDAWIEPAPVLGRPSKVTVRAVDRETRAAVRGTVTIYGARDTTRVPTNRPFIHVFRCDSRRRGASTITTCERITVTAPDYAPVVVSYAGRVHPHPSAPEPKSELSSTSQSITRGPAR